MKLWTFAAPVALLASQALATNWIALGTDDDGDTIQLDKDSIRRGDDSLVYYAYDDETATYNKAGDCEKHVDYVLRVDDGVSDPTDFTDWRDHPHAIKSDSTGDALLKYVCANAG